MGTVGGQSLAGEHIPKPVMAASHIFLIMIVSSCYSHIQSSPILKKRAADAMSLAVGDAEAINARSGFFGNPLYRPYGFSAWGYGSDGFMTHRVVVAGPNLYGGFYLPG